MERATESITGQGAGRVGGNEGTESITRLLAKGGQVHFFPDPKRCLHMRKQ